MPWETVTPACSRAFNMTLNERRRRLASPSTITGTSHLLARPIRTRSVVPELPAWSTVPGGRHSSGFRP